MGAREYFDSVAAASHALRRAELELAFGPAARGGGGRGPCDPVLARVLCDERARARMAAAQGAVGEALERIEGLRRLYSRKADALELRYVDLLPWEAVAEELGTTERSARRWRDELCDWVDSFGWARAREGRGVAEG